MDILYGFSDAIDNLHVRLIFDLGKNFRKELIKISKIAKFGYEML